MAYKGGSGVKYEGRSAVFFSFSAGLLLLLSGICYAQSTPSIAAKGTPLTPVKGTPVYNLNPKSREGTDYLNKTVIFKLKNRYRDLVTADGINEPYLLALIQELGLKSLSRVYPNHPAPVSGPAGLCRNGQNPVDLSLIYELRYTAEISLQQALNKMARLGLFEYAEPHVIPKVTYTVNDPNLSLQYNIFKIQDTLAWNISIGDTNTVIGIVDTGTQPTHPDLAGNIKHNYGDTIDGIDNDHDGYIDNFSGWDLGNGVATNSIGNNNPTWQGDPHGVHVSGIAAAVTDNDIGIAGVGFKCRFLPVKIADSTGTLVAAYPGIVYAADHGCKIINCSWGGSDGGSYGQDIVNYATNNKDALVVAAAGNNGDESVFYPAYYQNVISVAATTSTDAKASYSDYGPNVSICAPGDNIYSTYSGGTYTYLSGTSMATPCVSGAIAIVRSYFPSYTAIQAAERLMVTADTSIYNPSVNPVSLANLLGSGRVNLYRALSDPPSPAVTLTSQTITDKANPVPLPGDTLMISGLFTNYLAPTTKHLKATLSTTSPYAGVLPGTAVAAIGLIPTMGTATNSVSPFKVVVAPGTPLSSSITFQVTFQDSAYTSFGFFSITVNPDYLNVAVNYISTSVTSKGIIGYNNSIQTIGLGFQYKGNNMEYDGGLMIGVPDSAVSNVIRGLELYNNQDFISTSTISKVTVSPKSDFDTQGYFNDSAAQQPLPVLVHHRSFAWTDSADSKYVVYRYTIHNTGSAPLNSLYAGLLMDWDVIVYSNNRASFDSVNRMGYSWYTGTNGIYAGIKLLSHTSGVNVYAFDNVPGGAGGIDIYDQFDEAQKYQALSTQRKNAGVNGVGDDILDMVSAGPISLNVGDSVEVAFALLGGDNLADLQNSAVNAQSKYDGVILGTAPVEKRNGVSLNSYPNPASGNAVIEVSLPSSTALNLTVRNVMGQQVFRLASDVYSPGYYRFNLDVSQFSGGIYFIELIAEGTELCQKMLVTK